MSRSSSRIPSSSDARAPLVTANATMARSLLFDSDMKKVSNTPSGSARNGSPGLRCR